MNQSQRADKRKKKPVPTKQKYLILSRNGPTKITSSLAEKKSITPKKLDVGFGNI